MKDRLIIGELARQVAEIAALPVQQETIRLWKALNALRPVRPMVMIDQVPWHEMNVADELTVRSQDDFARSLETRLRRTLYAWNHMRADMVVEPFIDLRMVLGDTGFGIDTKDVTAVTDPASDVLSHRYVDQLKDDADIARIRAPRMELDAAATARVEDQAADLLGGNLGVRMEGYDPWFRLWDIITGWHSPEACLYDLALRPDFIHRLMRRLTEAHMTMLDDVEARGLMCRPQSLIHCTGAWTDELPAAGHPGTACGPPARPSAPPWPAAAAGDPARPRARDVWTAGMAQIFSAVSPAMHKEFEIDYAAPWYARFGLGYYGCCEPLHQKIDIIRLLPNVRKISMSPWVDVEQGAERIGPDYVFSRKPSPAFLAWDSYDLAAVEADLRATLAACARHGCPVELILKDISTVRYHPDRLWQWSALAMRLVEAQH